MAKKTTGKKAAVKKQLSKGARQLSVMAPLAALLAEEVRAAQVDTVPTLDLSVFDSTAQPEVVQDLALSQEADAEFAQEVQSADVAEVEALADAGASHSDRLLLAQSAAAEGASGTVASDAGSSVVTTTTTSSTVGAAEASAFELSSLPAAVVGGPVGAVAAVATAAVVVNNNNNGGTNSDAPVVTHNYVDVAGTTLNTSLSDLQSKGVEAVNTTAGELHLGAGSLSTLTGLPLFGDSNKDGVLSAAEKSALDVTLNITSQAQLNSLLSNANLANLSAAGVDHLHLDRSVASGNVVLSDAQVSALSAANLSIAANDYVVFDAATGTQLTGHIDHLQALGVDHVNIQLSSQAALEKLGDSVSLDQPLNLHGATATIDMASNKADVLDVHVHNMAQAGVAFASGDVVTSFVELDPTTVAGTHMASSIADLHSVGVHDVQVDARNPLHSYHFNVDLGNIKVSELEKSHPVFNANDHVTLNMTQEQATAFNVTNGQPPLNSLFTSMNIENIHIAPQGVNVSSAAPEPLLMQTLQEAGLSASIAAPATATVVSDDLAASIASQGMASTLASAEAVVIQAPALAEVSESQALKTSLQDIADVQAHAVESEATKVYVELGDNVNVDTLVSQLENNNTSLFADGQQAGLVVGQATFDAMTHDQISQLVGKLSDLGFTEVDVLNGQGAGQAYAIDATSQTLVTSQVEVLGAADAQALVDAFGQDILDPKQA